MGRHLFKCNGWTRDLNYRGEDLHCVANDCFGFGHRFWGSRYLFGMSKHHEGLPHAEVNLLKY